ncbi:MAG: phosphatidate cytidylyltransferase [Planctomycetota bacterium]
MNLERLRQLAVPFDVLDHPVTRLILAIVVGAILLSPLGLWISTRRPDQTTESRKTARTRVRTWLLIAPAIIVPILAGQLWTMIAIGVLAVLCYREFARATGLFRERLTSAMVASGIIIYSLVNIDHWPHLSSTLMGLVPLVIACVSILEDRPAGYIQRVGLGCGAFLLFGIGIGRLGSFAQDDHFRPMILLLLFCTQLNDLAAFAVGTSLSGPKLVPNTSPGKTLTGHIGGMLAAALAAYLLGRLVFAGTPMDTPFRMGGFAILVAGLGQLGDLLSSSIKRDIGIKDMGTLLPGHGGLLDRFNSVLLVAPGAYHYILHFNGIAPQAPLRILTGGWGVW